MALLHMAAGWCRSRGLRLLAATVNHGLRPEAGAEAAWVARACAALGVPHRTVLWQGWNGQGNLQDAARQARLGLLSEWAGAERLEVVLLGHTADDQAETVLMRLARGSGVDGLCGMDAAYHGGVFLRPLLEVPRADLRDWLTARDLPWLDDPSNDNARFDRVKARHLLAASGDLGLSVGRLTETADHMRRARKTLWQAAAEFAKAHVRAEAGDLILEAAALRLSRSDTEGRVLAAALQWIGSARYRPRYQALLDFAEGLQRGETRTLGGVRAVSDGRGGARLSREVSAASGPVAVVTEPGASTLWDGRWLLTPVGPPSGAFDPALTVAALGEAGLSACPDWRATGLPRPSLLASPAVWLGGRLVAAPLAGFATGWQARLCLAFDRFIVSH